MIRAPHMPAAAGRQTPQLAEALDLYRTLAALAGFPESAIELGVEGTDLSPVFQDPSTVVKAAASSQIARCPQGGTLGPESACNQVPLLKIAYQGYTVRVDAWRYTVWLGFDGATSRGKWDDVNEIVGEELYSHANDTGTDFDAFENANVVDQNPLVRQQLMALLRARFYGNASAARVEGLTAVSTDGALG